MTNVGLIVVGAVAESIGLILTVADLRSQQRRLALHQPPESSLGAPDDPTQHLVGQEQDADSAPWHNYEPVQMFDILEHQIEQEEQLRQAADQAVVKYLDERFKRAVRDIDRRRVVGDSRLRELMGSAQDWKVYRGPCFFVVGLVLGTAGSLL